jgi:hypothetical protein
LADSLGLVLDDLKARYASSQLLADIRIALRRPTQYTEHPGVRGVKLSSPTAFSNLGPLVLGHQALPLPEQLILGPTPELPIEADDLDPSPLELSPQQNLVGVLASQAIGGLDIEALHSPSRPQIPQPL